MIDKVNGQLQNFWKVATIQIGKAIPQVIVGLVIFLIAFLLAVLVKYIIVRMANRAKKRLYLYRLIGSTAMMVILVAGLITALGTMGINVAALVTSVGLIGFAVSFALKDTLSNMMAGFVILFYQPFKSGDLIEVDKVEGEVINITLRFTVVRTDHQRTYVPNSLLLTNPLTVKDPQPKSS